jgi:hypothetical protein
MNPQDGAQMLAYWASQPKPPKLSHLRLASRVVRFRRQLIEHFLKCREIPGTYHLPD